MENNILNFTQQMQFKELKVRGLYLSIACDMEFLMADIIAKLEIEQSMQHLRQKEKEDKIFQLEMGKKLGKCIKLLTAYRDGVYYDRFKEQFDIIEKLLFYRNLFAHGHSEYDENKTDDSFIVFKNYKGRNVTETIIVEPFIIEMELYRKSLMRILDLVTVLCAERGVK